MRPVEALWMAGVISAKCRPKTLPSQTSPKQKTAEPAAVYARKASFGIRDTPAGRAETPRTNGKKRQTKTTTLP